MSDAIRLPARPNLEQYKKLAKDFQHACSQGTPDAIRAWATAWLDRLDGSDPGDLERIARTWKGLLARKPELARCSLTDAQFVIARFHEFPSWPAFAQHVEAMAREQSGTALFESAVDAIVSGDAETLRRLLREHPALVRERSTRAHRATLLHYVSANGVEDFRQKTPKNIVEIARMLLDAGADVNAGSNSYGTDDTTMLLTATSVHPEVAGVQIPLLDLLLERGAKIDWPKPGDVIACLHNGRGLAAAYLASRGATLDLEGAAGVGRLDVVREYVAADGTVGKGATRKQLIDGFAWACEYGHTNVVEYLVDAGLPLDAQLRHDGQSPLHWAAYGGHPAIVRMLIERGAAVNLKDPTYDGTPLEWAIYAWGNRDMTGTQADPYYEVVRLLVDAGSSVDPHWLNEDDAERGRAKRKLLADPRMREALGRQR